MPRHPEPSATPWKVATAILGSLAVMFALAAWRNGAELEQLQQRPARPTKATEITMPDEVWTPAPQLAEPTTTAPQVIDGENLRCIGGQLFRKAGNEWQQLGRC